LLNIVSQPQVQSLLDDARQRIAEEEGVSFRSVNGTSRSRSSVTSWRRSGRTPRCCSAA
jgi:hypothetical protein